MNGLAITCLICMMISLVFGFVCIFEKDWITVEVTTQLQESFSPFEFIDVAKTTTVYGITGHTYTTYQPIPNKITGMHPADLHGLVCINNIWEGTSGVSGNRSLGVICLETTCGELKAARSIYDNATGIIGNQDLAKQAANWNYEAPCPIAKATLSFVSIGMTFAAAVAVLSFLTTRHPAGAALHGTVTSAAAITATFATGSFWIASLAYGIGVGALLPAAFTWDSMSENLNGHMGVGYGLLWLCTVPSTVAWFICLVQAFSSRRQSRNTDLSSGLLQQSPGAYNANLYPTNPSAPAPDMQQQQYGVQQHSVAYPQPIANSGHPQV